MPGMARRCCVWFGGGMRAGLEREYSLVVARMRGALVELRLDGDERKLPIH